MEISLNEVWFGLARAVASADGYESDTECIAAYEAQEKLLGITPSDSNSPWENSTASHQEVISGLRILAAEDPDTCASILVGLVYVAQADGKASPEEADLMWRMFHMLDYTEKQVIEICKRASTLKPRED